MGYNPRMLWWYWLGGLIGAPVCVYYGQHWWVGIAMATPVYFVKTLASGLDNVGKYHTWRIYQVWDAVLFLVAGAIALFGWIIPHDRPGIQDEVFFYYCRQSVFIFTAIYFIGWLVLRRIFSPKTAPSATFLS